MKVDECAARVFLLLFRRSLHDSLSVLLSWPLATALLVTVQSDVMVCRHGPAIRFTMKCFIAKLTTALTLA
jgi:hypothetical protein